MDTFERWKSNGWVAVETKATRFFFNRFPEGDNSRLIVAGVHGDELAPVYAAHRFLNYTSATSVPHPVAIIPDFRMRRDNIHGVFYNGKILNTNRGFTPNKRNRAGIAPSVPAVRAIIKEQALWRRFARHLFLSLHEDVDMTDQWYAYTFTMDSEKNPTPAPYKAPSHVLPYIGILNEFFTPAQSEEIGYVSPDRVQFNDEFDAGVCLNSHDTSWESYAYLEWGTEISLCTETPGRGEMEKRIACNLQLIRKATGLI